MAACSAVRHLLLCTFLFVQLESSRHATQPGLCHDGHQDENGALTLALGAESGGPQDDKVKVRNALKEVPHRSLFLAYQEWNAKGTGLDDRGLSTLVNGLTKANGEIRQIADQAGQNQDWWDLLEEDEQHELIRAVVFAKHRDLKEEGQQWKEAKAHASRIFENLVSYNIPFSGIWGSIVHPAKRLLQQQDEDHQQGEDPLVQIEGYADRNKQLWSWLDEAEQLQLVKLLLKATPSDAERIINSLAFDETEIRDRLQASSSPQSE